MKRWTQNLNKVNELGSQINNFIECYKECELWGGVDGPVSAEKLIDFIIENPHLIDIAKSIEKLGKEAGLK